MWYGESGPELGDTPFWPQKRTVRSMLRTGVLVWGKPLNKTQEECGIIPLELAEAYRAAGKVA